MAYKVVDLFAGVGGLSTIIVATPCNDFNSDYNPYQTVSISCECYNVNVPPKWSYEMTIYGNDTSATTNF